MNRFHRSLQVVTLLMMTVLFSAFPALAESTGVESHVEVRPNPDLDPGELAIRVEDEHGRPLTARVRMTHLHGEHEGEHADLRGRGLTRDHAFIVDERLTGSVPPGRYRLSVHVGQDQEYVPAETELTVDDEAGREAQVVLGQWFDPNAMGWYSADLHLHSYRYGDVDITAGDGQPQFEAENDRGIARQVDYGFIAQLGRSSGLDLTVDNVHQHMEMTEAETRRLEETYSRPDALLMISSEVKLDPSGHVNVPGTRPGLQARADPTGAFRIRDLLEQTREENGALVYTHPTTIPWFTRMSALEMYAHLVDEDHGDLFDIGPWSTFGAQTKLFGLWNTGVRIAAGATSDNAVNSLLGPQRTYIQAEALTPDAMLEGIRQGRTIAADGPIFATIRIPAHDAGPGDRIEPGRYELEIEAHAYRGLDYVDVVVDGRVVESYEGDDRTRFFETRTVELQPGGYVSIKANDGHGRGTSIPTAIFAEGAPRHDKYASLLVINDLNRRSTRIGDYFLHLIASVNREDRIESIEITKDGQTLRHITPTQGRFPSDADFVPYVRGHWDHEHEEGWVFRPGPDEARHVFLSCPLEGDGEYQALVHTRSGRVLDAGRIDFEQRTESWQGGIAQLLGRQGETRYMQWAYSDVPEIGQRIVSSGPWERFGIFRTEGPGGDEMEYTFRLDHDEHPTTVHPGSLEH